MNIFNIVSNLDRKIKLTEVQWKHIKSRHKELVGQTNKIIETLVNPTLILYSEKDDVYHYCKLFQKTPVSKKYLLVVVKHINGEGFIITAFFVSKLRRKDKEIIYGKENINSV